MAIRETTTTEVQPMKSRISRRAFIKDCSKGVAAAAVAPYLLGPGVGKVFGAPVAQDMSLEDYYAHFGVDGDLIRRIISEALSRGGDYCDLYFQHTINNRVTMEDRAVNRAYNNIDYGVGIRVLKGDQTGYSFTEEITPEAMKLAARTAANIASSPKKVKPVGLKLHKTPNYYPVKTPWEDVSIDEKIPYLHKVNDRVFDLDPRIIKATVGFSNETSYVLVATSEGRVVYDHRPMGQCFASCTAEQDGRRESNYYVVGGRMGLEFLSRKNIDRLTDEAVRRTVDLFDAVKPAAGEMEVVLAAGSSGILLHEAIGHGMEADFNRKGISIFSDKIDKPVAKDFVNIIDDGTMPNLRGSLSVDDEGNDTGKTYLVRDGILRSYLHDRISSLHYNVTPTGSGRRESFRYAPIPRMRNTYMLPGPHKREEIIESVKKGIYAEHFTNGQVYIGAGDFTFYVKSGYLIEDGKMTKAVKDINVIGNGPEVLSNIVMVANDIKWSEGGGTCGKDGQGVPVSMGLPTTKVSKITVGGLNT
jgi:TldD protein